MTHLMTPTSSGLRSLSREVWPSFLVKDETGTVAVEGQLQMLVDPSDGGPNLPADAYALLEADDVRMNDL